MSFMTRVRDRQLAHRHVCVGLDSDYAKMPECLNKPGVDRAEVIFQFNKAIIDATKDVVCAFKPNVAFYEDVFGAGRRALQETIKYLHQTAFEVPIILDAKRADIGKTNVHYCREAFEVFNADAVTVNPYFGQEGLQPFLDNPEKGIIVLCRTSNKGAAEFQNRRVELTREEFNFLIEQDVESSIDADGLCLGKSYALVAYAVSQRWNKNGNCALVVGATAPAELAQIRRIVGDMQLLIPGIGAQGGDLEATVKAGADSTGTGMIINSSSGVIFASAGGDFAEVAGVEAKKLNDAIKAVLASRN